MKSSLSSRATLMLKIKQLNSLKLKKLNSNELSQTIRSGNNFWNSQVLR